MDIKLSILGGRTSFSIDGVANNPPLKVYQGQRVELKIDTHPHPFTIKTGLGLGFGFSYGVKPGPNGISTGTMVWDVPKDAPPTLYYQSSADESIWGLIHVKSLELESGLRRIDLEGLENLAVTELIDVLNHNAATALTANQELAGYGLHWDGSKFSLESDTTVYEDERGIFRSTRNVQLLDQVEVTGRDNLSIKDALNEIVSQIRRLIGGESWNDEPADSIEGLSRRFGELEVKYRALGNEYLSLKREYETLAAAYQELVQIYRDHKHSAKDIVSGNLAPERVAYGEFRLGSRAVVGENGELYWED